MGRTGVVLIVANLAVLAAWLILQAVWFEGAGLGCEHSDVADFDACSDRADTLVALGLAAVTLLVGTVVTFAVRGAGRVRAARRGAR